MGLFSIKFEAEERAFIKEVTERGVLFEDAAKIRVKYGKEFYDRESFEHFKNEVRKLLKNKARPIKPLE
jgi:hypothetical protein